MSTDVTQSLVRQVGNVESLPHSVQHHRHGELSMALPAPLREGWPLEAASEDELLEVLHPDKTIATRARCVDSGVDHCVQVVEGPDVDIGYTHAPGSLEERIGRHRIAVTGRSIVEE